ncbi:MAG: deaminase, partial [Salinibacterium sp.]|nr:deaminase [Salinibacterium sp.]
SQAPRFVGDGVFPWTSDRRATLADVRQIGDVVLLRYALSARFALHEAEGKQRLGTPRIAAGSS